MEEARNFVPDITDYVAHPPPPTQTPTRFGRTFEAFAIHDFCLLWSSTVLSGFGQWGQQISLNWLVYVLTGSAVQLGAVSFAAGLVGRAVTPFAGLLADRVPRRTILWISSSFGAATAVVIAFLVIVNLIEVWHAYAFSLISGVTMAINQPARQAAVFDTSTADTLQNAVAMNSLAQNLSRIVGPPFFGLIAVWSLGASFALIVVMRGLAAAISFALSRQARQTPPTTRRTNPFADIWDGFRYLITDARLTGLMVINSVPAFIVYPYLIFLPVFSDEVFGAEADVYGYLLAMMGVGSTIGLLALAALHNLQHRGRWMLVGFLVYLVFITAFTQSDFLPLSLILLIAAGMVHGLALALNTLLFQIHLRDDMRGRGMAAWQMGFSLMPLGALPMGIAIDRWGVQNGVGGFVILCFFFFVLVALFWRPLRNMN